MDLGESLEEEEPIERILDELILMVILVSDQNGMKLSWCNNMACLSLVYKITAISIIRLSIMSVGLK